MMESEYIPASAINPNKRVQRNVDHVTRDQQRCTSSCDLHQPIVDDAANRSQCQELSGIVTVGGLVAVRFSFSPSSFWRHATISLCHYRYVTYCLTRWLCTMLLLAVLSSDMSRSAEP
jgi:hypothetical protein